MKKLTTLVVMAMMSLMAMAQNETYYTKYFDDPQLVQKAEAWVADTKNWAGSFTKATPDSSMNCTEFYLQYQKNKKQWDQLFEWLQKTDLINIPRDKFVLEGTGITISIEDSKNQPIEERRSESHHHKCDFMFVVKGGERLARLDHFSSVPNCQWKPDVIHYDYDASKLQFIDTKNDKFVIFFPNDWHIAKIATKENTKTRLRVIVAKMDYID